ncbi:MAG: hypothetical protein ABI472_01210 [Ginsengibacter sp.]
MKIKTLLFLAILLFAMSCTKTEKSNIPPTEDKYLTTSSGSSWNYHKTDSSGSTPVSSDYTLSSTSRDSSINGKSYHVFTISNGSNQYLYNNGNDYYQFDSLPVDLSAAPFERLYLKDNAALGTNWIQSLTVSISGNPIPVILKYTIEEKGISRTVNGMTYSDVIHVSTSISSSLIPPASFSNNINSYYAKKYGLIENSTIVSLNYPGFMQNIHIETRLVSASL